MSAFDPRASKVRHRNDGTRRAKSGRMHCGKSSGAHGSQRNPALASPGALTACGAARGWLPQCPQKIERGSGTAPAVVRSRTERGVSGMPRLRPGTPAYAGNRRRDFGASAIAVAARPPAHPAQSCNGYLRQEAEGITAHELCRAHAAMCATRSMGGVSNGYRNHRHQ
jgi:hypothetical protein